jgi:hypothetical protein
MSCVMRVSGRQESIDKWLAESSLGDETWWRPRQRDDGLATMNVEVSGAAIGDLPQQIADAIAFFTAHGAGVRALSQFPDITTAQVDFALKIRSEMAGYSVVFPSELVRLLGDAQVEVSMSHYAVSD